MHVILSVPIPSLSGLFASSAMISSKMSSINLCFGSLDLRVTSASLIQVETSAELKQSHIPSHASTKNESVDFRYRRVISGMHVMHYLSTVKFLFYL